MFNRRIARKELRKLWYEGLIGIEEKGKIFQNSGYSSQQALLKHMNTDNGSVKEEVQQAIEAVYTEVEFDALYQLAYGRPFIETPVGGYILPNEVNDEFVSILREILKQAHTTVASSNERTNIAEVVSLANKFAVGTNSRLTTLNIEF